MKYTVSIAVDGRIDVEIEAESFEDAKEKALLEVCDSDLDSMEFIGTQAVNAEDENGIFKDY